ncbi:hypothetical protein [Ruminococcus flavefaciens]|uniref:hypothetical protein n=1 Tax=Ruminococcus flavefaciens TaxID=1265 RepID=UPI0026EA963B|nr:hypothetical protein [Ruminococcus flavefaciens]
MRQFIQNGFNSHGDEFKTPTADVSMKKDIHTVSWQRDAAPFHVYARKLAYYN